MNYANVIRKILVRLDELGEDFRLESLWKQYRERVTPKGGSASYIAVTRQAFYWGMECQFMLLAIEAMNTRKRDNPYSVSFKDGTKFTNLQEHWEYRCKHDLAHAGVKQLAFMRLAFNAGAVDMDDLMMVFHWDDRAGTPEGQLIIKTIREQLRGVTGTGLA